MNKAITTNIVFHTGYTKAASTSLQEFFRQHEDLHFVNRALTYKKLVVHSSLEYEPSETKKFIDEEVGFALSQGKIPVFSHERLSGNPHSGHYDAKEIIDRIFELVPNAKIIIVIREQISMIASCYNQYIRIGGTKTLENYISSNWEYRIPQFNAKAYEYHRILHYYFGLFGEKNVLVLLFEDLLKDAHTFYHRVCEFMEIPKDHNVDLQKRYNPSLPDDDIEGIRLMNFFETKRVAVRDPNPFSNYPYIVFSLRTLVKWRFMKKEGRDIKTEVREFLGNRFAESNRITSELIRKNLAEYSYET